VSLDQGIDVLKINVETPGKIMIAGEWAILLPKTPCIVSAINRYVYVELASAEQDDVSATNFDLREEKHDFAKKALHVVRDYLGQMKREFFKISIDSSDFEIKMPEGGRKKIGLGSSAAVVVGLISAVFSYYDYNIESDAVKELIFKLASIAHFLEQGRVGSCFDIAASAFGGLLCYERFDADWLISQLEKNRSIREITEQRWPGLKIQQLKFPKEWIVTVGFVGYSASTTDLVRKVRPSLSTVWAEKVREQVGKLREAFETNNFDRAKGAIKANRKLLQELSPLIETKELSLLADIADEMGAAGKLSGAGGGDCGIALCKKKQMCEAIENRWKSADIIYLKDRAGF
jgi:phosphomevalonate kinase